jgi:hypothetical protein
MVLEVDIAASPGQGLMPCPGGIDRRRRSPAFGFAVMTMAHGSPLAAGCHRVLRTNESVTEIALKEPTTKRTFIKSTYRRQPHALLTSGLLVALLDVVALLFGTRPITVRAASPCDPQVRFGGCAVPPINLQPAVHDRTVALHWV